MIERAATYLAWILIACVLCFGIFYAFTPIGLAVIVPTLLLAALLRRRGRRSADLAPL